MRSLRRSHEESGVRCAGVVVILAVVSAMLFSGGCSGLVSGTTSNGGGTPTLTISNITATNATATSVLITWQTNVAANSQLEYGTSSSYGSTTPLDSTMVTNHQATASNLKPGTLYHFRVHSADTSNNSAVSGDMTFSTAADAPPTVSITAPAPNASLTGVVTVTASATDDVGVASVQFKVDNTNTGPAITNAPYSYALNTSTLSNGNHTLTAVATDVSGLSATSAGVPVKISNTAPDTTPPVVTITSPVNNASVSGTITVTATATDPDSPVSFVQFQVDGANAGGQLTAAPYSIALDTTKLSNGSHKLTASAKDPAGNQGTSPAVTVTVNNTAPDTTPPVVTITSPVNNASVSGTITVMATATDPDSPVSFVQFQVDGTNLGGQITAAPYSTSLDTTKLPNGTHTLTAVGADPSGNQGTSAPTVISVANPTGSTMGPLVQSTTNPHYFVDKNGKAVVLTGSHTWNDFQDTDTSVSPAAFDFNSYAAFLKARGQNATILWHQDLPQFCGFPPGGVWKMTPWPWQRTGPGNASDGDPRFDLTQFNQAYFDRLRQRVLQLEQNNIYAIVELFGGEWIGSFRCGTTSPAGDGYALTGVNNVNGVDDGYSSGSNGSASITTATPNTFTTIQVAYMKKVVDTLNDLPNVLWEIDEEPVTGTENWHNYVISQLRSYEATKPNQHPIGYTTMRYPGNDTELLNSNADWIAPILSGGGGNVVSPVNNCGTGTPACKIILNDSDHSFYYLNFLNSDGSVQNQKVRNYIWENFTAGSSVLFMDPYEFYWPINNRNFCTGPVNGICSGIDTKYDAIRNAMGYVISLTAKLDLVKMTPRSALTSTMWCLANNAAVGAEFVVYAPTGGTFTVNLSAQSGRTLVVEWLNPATGAVSSGGTVSGGSAAQSFTPPFSGDAVLYLVDSTGHN